MGGTALPSADGSRTRPGTSAASPARGPSPSTTLVPAGGRFVGLVACRGDARIDGLIEGEVRADGSLQLGPTARVQGEIEVDELIIAGSLEGDVRARTRIELRASARVNGVLEAPLLVMADGSILEGCCRVGIPSESPEHHPESGSPTA